MPIVTCRIAGCDKPVKSSRMCSMHLERNRKYGSPHTVMIEHRKKGMSEGEFKAWFLEQLVPTPSPSHVEGECLIWTKCKDGGGYGFATWPRGGRGRRAHIVAWRLEHGYWPKECCHHCDVPACCNPAHLYDGTHAQNMIDRAVRAPRKLLPSEVLEIHAECTDYRDYRRLAERYGVSRYTIKSIHNGQRWWHLTGGRRHVAAPTKMPVKEP